MRSLQLAAIIFASLGASAATPMSADVSFNSGCTSTKQTGLTTVSAVAEAIAGATDSKCTSATLHAAYTLDAATRCTGSDDGVTDDKLSLESVASDFKILGTSKPITVESLILTYTTAMEHECASTALNSLPRVTDCSGTRTPLSVDIKRSNDNTSIEYTPKSGETVTLDALVSTDLLASSKTCLDENNANIGATLTLQATYDLNQIQLSNVEVTFDETECTPTECKSLQDTASVLVCLAAASADSNCMTAHYTRTFNAVGSGVCDPSMPNKFQLSLEKLIEEENWIYHDDKSVSITGAYFSEKASDATQCGTPQLTLASDCEASGVASDLDRTDETLLHFEGKQTFDVRSTPPEMIVNHPDAESGCAFVSDSDGDKFTVETTIRVGDALPTPAGSPMKVSVEATLLIFGAFSIYLV